MKRTPLPLPDTFPLESLFGFSDLGEECFDEIEDAVRHYVEGHEWPTIAQCIEGAEWPIIVDEFKQMAKPTPERLLERLLEAWHEDYGDPAGDPTDPTPAMVAAMQTIIDGLAVWGCEETGRSFAVTKEDAKRMICDESIATCSFCGKPVLPEQPTKHAMHADCLKQEIADRRRDEEKDER